MTNPVSTQPRKDVGLIKDRLDLLEAAPPAHASTHLPGGSDALTTAAAGTIQPDDLAAEGSAASFARSDHKHSIVAAAAGAATPGDAAAEGVATSFARSDHKHSLPAFGTTAGTFCQGNDSRLSDSRAPTGSAGGSLAGTYPNPTLAIGTLTSGTWTPTLTNVTNITSSTPSLGQYLQVGSIVFASVEVTVNPTAASQITLAISLPVASNLAALSDLNGTGSARDQTANTIYAAVLAADTAGDRAYLIFYPGTTNSYTTWVMFAYQVL